jgi:CubicO group peptidase (beta-lactamase class C family)
MVNLMKTLSALTIAATFAALGLTSFAQPSPDVGDRIDGIFARWNTSSTPGCAVGASVDGRPALAKAYGMADLEHDVKITPDTIFEAGSVSKQFTAAAVLLLARDGKLSLDDPVKKYVPELPESASGVTIRHMLNHTSGLRDWGSIAAIGGWPRTSRVYTHAHVLEIVSRQRALNFPPGTKWSYSNTGYNLAAIIVGRVGGVPFAAFTRQRLFAPLGMTHTSWRDDHTRVVKGRAIAYDEEKDGFHTDMPFEKVHGNGGLLTTVGDLLKWNENFAAPTVGDRGFVDEEQQPGRFNDGRTHFYALGLMIRASKGVRIVEHSGSTAGYQAHLMRYPDQHVSVAVLCNSSSAAASQYAHSVGELYVADALQKSPTATHALTAAEIERASGVYRDRSTGMTLTVVAEKNQLRVERGPSLVAVSPERFTTEGGDRFELNGRELRWTDPYGTVSSFERLDPWTPSRDRLQELAGTYASDEAETVLTVALEGDSLVARRRPDSVLKLTPVYTDAFRAPQLGLVIFRRDGSGRVNELSVVQDRVWDLRFARQSSRSVSQ